MIETAGLTLTPPQREVIDSGLLETGFNSIIQMPTGAGKTWLAERAIEQRLASGRRAIYVTPLRALAEELSVRWSQIFGKNRVGIFTGDYGTTGTRKYPLSFDEARLLILTPERLDAITRTYRAHWGWIPEVDICVIDELHLLGDSVRGARLEGAMLRFMSLNPFAQIIGLSATIGNKDEVAGWLGGVAYHSSWRPIPLIWKVVRFKKPAEKPDLLLSEVARNIRAGGKSVVFVQSRKRAEEIARFLSDAGSLRSMHHHAGLSHAERLKTESLFRTGGCDVLVATSTVELGLNLPCRQSVIYDLQRFNGAHFEPLPVTNIWQRAGRAGRPGLDKEGEVVLIAAGWDKEASKYEAGIFEPIKSGLRHSQALAEQLVVHISSGYARNENQLDRILSRTLAASQKSLPPVRPLVKTMLDAGMLTIKEAHSDNEDEGNPRQEPRLVATRLGHIASRHMLSPSTILHFNRAFKEEIAWTFFDLLLLASTSEDCEISLTADLEELDYLAERLAGEPSSLLQLPHNELASLLTVDGKALLSALKTALVARDWTRRANASEIAETNHCYPSEVERIRDTLVRCLGGMLAVARTPSGTESTGIENTPPIEELPTLDEKTRILLRMVAAGLDTEQATLTIIKGVGPKIARKLISAGITDIEELAGYDPNTPIIIRGIRHERIAAWAEQASRKIKTFHAFRYREEGSRPVLLSSNSPGSAIDLYRLRRALELNVEVSEGGTFYISGGLEPHTVTPKDQFRECDCADFIAGAPTNRLCKHLMAVLIKEGDATLTEAVRDLKTKGHLLDLRDLWRA